MSTPPTEFPAPECVAVPIPCGPDASSTARIGTYVLDATGGDSLGDVVICHGTPWSSRMWLPLARRLSSRWRVHLWDMPGYGTSLEANAASPVDLVAQRTRFARLLRHWDLAAPHVIAHDIGGAAALGAHLFEGSRFGSLHLSDIVTLSPWGSPFFRLVAESQGVFAALPPALHRALVTEYIAGAGGPGLSREWITELARPWTTPAGQTAFYRQIATLRPEHTAPIAARLAKVRCPVRIAWGESDLWIPVAHAEALAAALPGGPEVTRFPTVGHLAVLEAPEAFAAEVVTWLSTQV
ncbi:MULTISPECIES: alpha/beta fold hydrolase [unclassified Brevibacterium]|uniref:alpha/beta fold hydrolase n=1 Tax=unclassified Brevibacterium TaxID=2614124 RepID=UPI0036318E77